MAVLRVAVITGANKGIGFQICRQLTSNGVLVVLTARDEKRGIAAAEKLNELGLSELVVFHVLDVANPYSIASLADFVKNKFGRLDILVNNAGIFGAVSTADGMRASFTQKEGTKLVWSEIFTETYELADDCIKTNYYGTRRMVDAFIPLLQLSDSPRIVNVSSTAGKLKNVANGWAKGVLEDVENLTDYKIDEVLAELLKDFKEGLIRSKGWGHLPAYIVSKAAVNAYTRILANKYPLMCINCICPGYVKTDINYNTGFMTAEEGAANPVRLALLPNGSPSGLFYIRDQVATFE